MTLNERLIIIETKLQYIQRMLYTLIGVIVANFGVNII